MKKPYKVADRNCMLQIVEIQQKIKSLYDELNSYINQLVKNGQIGIIVITCEDGDDVPYQLVDQYADKNVVFRACGVRRFDVVKVKKSKKDE